MDGREGQVCLSRTKSGKCYQTRYIHRHTSVFANRTIARPFFGDTQPFASPRFRTFPPTDDDATAATSHNLLDRGPSRQQNSVVRHAEPPLHEGLSTGRTTPFPFVLIRLSQFHSLTQSAALVGRTATHNAAKRRAQISREVPPRTKETVESVGLDPSAFPPPYEGVFNKNGAQQKSAAVASTASALLEYGRTRQ